MSSFVYLMHIPDIDEELCHGGKLYKIGITTNLDKRLIELKKQFEKDIKYITYVSVDNDKLYSIEKHLHRKYNKHMHENPFDHKYSTYKEYFIFNDGELDIIIDDIQSYSDNEKQCNKKLSTWDDDEYKFNQYALKQHEVDKLLSNCNKNKLFEKVLIEVGLSTGCRRYDLASIEKDNINLIDNIITYAERKKGGRIMKVYFGDKLKIDLFKYIVDDLPTDCKWLFPSPYGYDKHISDRTIWNIFKNVCERAGISQRPVHALRATFVKSAIANGWSLIQIADHIGDTPATVEKYYAVPSIGEMAEVAKNKEVI